MASYRVLVRNRARKGWEQLRQRHPKAMAELVRYLATTSLTRTHRTKMLRGRFSGLIQYHVSAGDRVWYWVEGNVVRIEHTGGHPKGTE